MREYIRNLGLKIPEVKRILKDYKQGKPIGEVFDKDIEIDKLKAMVSDYAKKYQMALRRMNILENQIEVIQRLRKSHAYYRWSGKQPGISEAIPIIVASDWHIDETVIKDQVVGKNEFNAKIAHSRIEWFFKNSLRLIDICSRDVKINTVCFALLGDFISGAIHDELKEANSDTTMFALLKAQKYIKSGIKFFLRETDHNLIIPCVFGNHSRITVKKRHRTAAGNSLEYFMYRNLAKMFEDEPRITFVINPGELCYVKLYDKVIRFHHGDGIRYMGGVGGITIPANKAIAQYNKLREADIDVFAHWHTRMDNGNFLINGSLIGYSEYALSIKASYGRPSQLFFLLDKKRGKTIVAPIVLEKV